MTESTSKTLRDWIVTRSGAGLVVHGVDIATGEQTKLTNVREIQPPKQSVDHEVRAIDKAGVEHRLIFA